ncbi:alpha/beta fold hydrolase [Ancylobacter pratisalsi]|uniref:Alpha/beta hydrolase n=1 Tax=Ancylobacter pratisalsi TaxID=1745854 RepID=A0A6P1YIY2_9HYPH|nr:alpha/beta hydrolase [Ancylobacter pratisalsi]QIB32970.1 alpha/beta hydrolase [Ancylobacter pratisalsi]
MAFVATHDGALEWIDANPGADPAGGSFILLHGIQGTASAWSDVANRLTDKLGTKRSVIVPNLRGRGASLAPDLPAAYGLDEFSDDLRAIVQMAPKPVTLVGWSMGVLVSLAYLARYGELGLDGLVLASGTSHVGDEAVWFHSDTLTGLAAEARERAERLALASYASPSAVAGAWASVRAADLRPVLPNISLPTLVLHGDLDDQCPLEHSRRIASAIPGAALEIWPGSGHNLMADDPQRLVDTILRFYAAVQADIFT